MKIFTMTREQQLAENFGLKWFDNGAGKQTIYNVYMDGVIVKTLISTKNEWNMFCHIIQLTENTFEYRFSNNAKKKYWKEAISIISAD